jgi:hypothetical protein
MSDTPATYASVESDGFKVSSNSKSVEQLTEDLKLTPEETTAEPEAEPEKAEKDAEAERLAKAAAELGKKGGEAAAAKRAAAKETPDEEEPEPGPDGKPLGKPRDDPRARMLEATRAAAELKRQVAEERRERERLAAEVAQLRAGRQEAPPPPKPNGDAEPQQSDFETYEDYVKATANYVARKAAAEHYEKQRAEAERRYMAHAYQEKIESSISGFTERLNTAARAELGNTATPQAVREWGESFMSRIAPEVAQLEPSFNLPPGQRVGPQNVIADELISSEHAPALMLHFTEHRDDLQRIASLRTPRDIAREMAKLEARLDAATTATSPKPQVSKANPPVRPVTGAPHTVDAEPGPDASYEDFKRYWNAREAREAKQRQR